MAELRGLAAGVHGAPWGGAVFETEAPADLADDRAVPRAGREREDEDAAAPRRVSSADDLGGRQADDPAPAAAPPGGRERGAYPLARASIGAESRRRRYADRVHDPDLAVEQALEAPGHGVEVGPQRERVDGDEQDRG